MGRTVVLLEARRAKEAADLVARYGGEAWSAPAMREAPLDSESEGADRLRELCANPADVVIFLTGVGARALFKLAGELGLEAELRQVLDRAIVAERGPKPLAVLRELGVRVDRATGEPHTSREILAMLEPDTFATAAIQLYGGPDPELKQGMETKGVRVLELPVYKWALPEDVQPLRDLIGGAVRADALVVTSATQIHNLFAFADGEGRGPELAGGLARLTLAAVGPVAAQALRDHGLVAAIVPEHPSMGALVRDLARHFAPSPSGRGLG
jgi:uroporphyrinogen-III synthase